MDILILHPNFPAQFRERALEFVRSGHHVTFVCQTHYGRNLPGVNKLTLTGRLGHQALLLRGQQELTSSHHRAKQYSEGLRSLASTGYRPNVIISHSGWGCGLHAADIWPDALVIGYVEWWYNSNSELHQFNSQCRWPIYTSGFRPSAAAKFDLKNEIILRELSRCHITVAPTHWQKHQLPPGLQAGCQVVFDGIDLDLFSPCAETRPRLITYGTRGMEVMRGFPEFIIEVKSLLKEFPDICIEIAGEDEIFYAGSPPIQGSWGEWAYDILRNEILSQNVRFLGRLSPRAYVQWLRSSWLHVYLTQPFIASWSLVEAMASGCAIVASNVSPVREFLSNGAFVPVDHRHEGWLTKAVHNLHYNPKSFATLKTEARASASSLSLNQSNLVWQSLICH